jgi:hypothetical protein
MKLIVVVIVVQVSQCPSSVIVPDIVDDSVGGMVDGDDKAELL